MIRRLGVGLVFVAVLVPRPGSSQLRTAETWPSPPKSVVEAAETSALVFRPPPGERELTRTLTSTLFGSATGAAATLLYFAARDEDTYECNACLERALVAGLATSLGTGLGARGGGVGGSRPVWAAMAGTLAGSLVGLALIEPLRAGWPAGAIGYVFAQGITTGLIAHGGRE